MTPRKRRTRRREEDTSSIEKRVLSALRRGNDLPLRIGTKDREEYAVERMMARKRRPFPDIMESWELGDLVQVYNTKGDGEEAERLGERLCERLGAMLCPAFYGERGTRNGAVFSDVVVLGHDSLEKEMRIALQRTIGIHLDGFQHYADKQGRVPGLMANGKYYQGAHPLHVTMLLPIRRPDEDRGEVPFGAVIASIMHDYFEDVPEELQVSKEELVERIAHGLPEQVRREVWRGIRAAGGMTFRKGEDTFRALDMMVASDPELDAAENRRITTYRLHVKAVDKIGGLPVIWPFPYIWRMKAGGKAWKAIDVSRRYLAENGDGSPLLKESYRLTTQAAIHWERAMGWAARNLKRELRVLFKEMNPRSYGSRIGRANRLVNRYIRDGGLKRVELDDVDAGAYRDVGGTLLNTWRLVSPLQVPSFIVPAPLRRPGESEEEARLRHLAGREAFGRGVPQAHPDIYLEAVSKEATSRTATEAAIADQFPDPGAAREAYLAMRPRFLVLRAAARKYSLLSRFFIPALSAERDMTRRTSA